jgi:glycosyl transferase family 25
LTFATIQGWSIKCFPVERGGTYRQHLLQGTMMKTRNLANLHVDAVLCINLREREDRRVAILKNFQDSGLKIEFFLVDKDKEDPQRGCYNSHRACAKLALERNYDRILILEDDAFIDPFSQGIVQRINNFLERTNPDLFYLGVLLGKIWLTWHRNIARCRGQGAHAYIISRPGCEKILSWDDYCGKGIDSVFSKRFKAYCVFPMMCYQDTSTSDIASFRRHIDGSKSTPEEEYNANNFLYFRKKQYIQAIKNIHKTFLLI